MPYPAVSKNERHCPSYGCQNLGGEKGRPSSCSLGPEEKERVTGRLACRFRSRDCLSFFLDYLDNTASSAEELEKRYGLTVLGAVEDLPKKGKNIETFIQDNPFQHLQKAID